MEIVILHYHLNRGGVTSVIENHLRSLASLPANERPRRVTVAYGGRRAAWNDDLATALPFECALAEIPALEYDNFRTSETSLLDSVAKLLDPLDRDSTVLHIHNHCLGKNVEIATVVGHFAEQGWRMLLQVHDFAEDLRPANYQHLAQRASSQTELHEQLYPQAAQIHYSVLNQRDQKILQTAGIADERLHLLPNPVQQQSETFDATQIAEFRRELAAALELPAGHAFVLYPVRPIRRKNLGELLLWSLLADDAVFGMTLSPLNPQEQTSYQRWVDFADAHELPVRFEVANRIDLPFEAVYAAADAIITTSVAEGFGMVYLEASLAERPLVGRKLPGVCDDFEAAGMAFPGLAVEFKIPKEAVDLEAVKRSHQRWIAKLRDDYGLPQQTPPEFNGETTLLSGDTIDFARLESDQQRDFLQRVNTEATLRETLRQLNPNLQYLAADEDRLQPTLEQNCRVIAEHYSQQVIGKKLRSCYEAVLGPEPTAVVRDQQIAQSVLHSFIHPNLLFPVRLES